MKYCAEEEYSACQPTDDDNCIRSLTNPRKIIPEEKQNKNRLKIGWINC